ncbi:hypothetical protein PYV02_14670 [Leifsonia sp. H3M29-4]|uniref:hypothetical protein n=1 Tax=Salinibacterium metalliresistens TaxID=3031321 RepID=UPI0023DB700D|nr:hypothetical protein [Salinibacterium metalliresistens]MDF1480326.1 hypothetical protein [Salinibacterium metalliresistens]
MATTDQVVEVLQRVGFAAVTYYSEIGVDDPEYNLAGQAAWCLESLPSTDRGTLEDLVARTIVEPREYREALVAALSAVEVLDEQPG